MQPCQIPIDSMPFVSQTGQGKTLKSHIHVNRTVDFNIMIYVTEGSMEIIEDGESYTIHKDQLFFLKAGLHHWGKKSFEIGTTWYYAHFLADNPAEDSKVMPWQSSFVPSPISTYRREAWHIEIPKILKLSKEHRIAYKIRHMIESNEENPLKKNLIMWDILMGCSEMAYGMEVLDRDGQRIQDILDYIDEHYHAKIEMKDITELTSLSYKYVSSIFKEKMGMTIMSYQQKKRIHNAKKLLGETRKTIGEVAEAVGYQDPFHFSKIFKKTVGISPLKYRQTYIPNI